MGNTLMRLIFGQQLNSLNTYDKIVRALCDYSGIELKSWMLKAKPSLTIKAFFFGLSDVQIGEQLHKLEHNCALTAGIPRDYKMFLNNYKDISLYENSIRNEKNILQMRDAISDTPYKSKTDELYAPSKKVTSETKKVPQKVEEVKPEVKPEPVEVKAEPEQEVKETEVTEQKIEDPDDEIDVMAIIEPLIANRKGMKAVNTAIVIKAVIDEDYELAREYLDRIIK
jgi:hypothetical protein